MGSDRWLNRLLRLPARPLQIPEVLEAAEEHLRAASLEGIERRYLPARLAITVSSADFQGLQPFEEELRAEMQGLVARLAARPDFEVVSPHLEIDLAEARDLSAGSAPRLSSFFPPGTRRAVWHPGLAQDTAVAVPSQVLLTMTAQIAHLDLPDVPSPNAPGIFEIVLTAGSAEQTALQKIYAVYLESILPAGTVDASQSRGLVVAIDGSLRTDDGQPWTGMAPKVSELSEGLPREIEDHAGSTSMPPSRLYQFYRPGLPEILWAPQGIVLLGRHPNYVHWVPSNPPPNLSGRHLAFVRGSDGVLRVADLRSTNGTYLGGRLMTPFELVPVSLPEVLEVGTEGTLRLDLRSPQPG